jgi:hypothetical protein
LKTVSEDPQRELRRLEERLLDPAVRRSAPAVADLLADEFIEFGSSGRVFDKPRIIESLQHEEPAERSITNFRATELAPGVMLVTYRVVRFDTPGAEPTSSLRSSIWTLRDGRWKMVFHQGTPAASMF